MESPFSKPWTAAMKRDKIIHLQNLLRDPNLHPVDRFLSKLIIREILQSL